MSAAIGPSTRRTTRRPASIASAASAATLSEEGAPRRCERGERLVGRALDDERPALRRHRADRPDLVDRAVVELGREEELVAKLFVGAPDDVEDRERARRLAAEHVQRLVDEEDAVGRAEAERSEMSRSLLVEDVARERRRRRSRGPSPRARAS